MKAYLTKNKEVIRWIAMIPVAAIIPIFPINIALLAIQLTCFVIMFWVGWDY